jgi:hypothetical protein
VWTVGNVCKAFDDAVYFDHLVARFLLTEARISTT